MKLIAYLVAGSLVAPSLAHAQASAELAQKSRVLWAAYQCSYYAEGTNQPDEQTRLFELGYQNGRAFLAAIRAGKIDREDMNRTVPVGVSWRLGGPSDDFMLGRIFEAAVDDASDKVFSGGANTEQERKVLASNFYRQNNCDLLR